MDARTLARMLQGDARDAAAMLTLARTRAALLPGKRLLLLAGLAGFQRTVTGDCTMNLHSYCVRHKNGWGTGCGPHPTHCYTCGAALPEPENTGAAGYGSSDEERALDYSGFTVTLKNGEHVTRSRAHCYSCCAKRTRADMIETGRATLYLVDSQASSGRAWSVQDWPGQLVIKPSYVKRGQHNMARTRFDAWFTGPDGKQWHGVNLGDNQILRCKRLKGN